MASQPQILEPRVAGRYRYKWHSAAFLATMFVIAMLALCATIVSSRASSTPLLDDATMSAAREVATTRLPQQVPLAQAGELRLMLPIYENAVTAIGFHPVDDNDVVSLSPMGHQVNGSIISRGLGQFFPQDGPQYVVMGDSGKFGSATQVMDVGAPAGTKVFAPVDGVIAGIKTYSLKGQCADVELQIRPQSQTRMIVVMTHLDRPEVGLGQPVRAGVTRLGSVRALDGCLEQPLRQYTYDNGNHLQMQVDLIK